jgi:hypothetical protein
MARIFPRNPLTAIVADFYPEVNTLSAAWAIELIPIGFT